MQTNATRAIEIAKFHGAPSILPYQLEGIEYLCSVASGLLGDDPGLGKTPQAILAAAALDLKMVVICCPLAVAAQWRDEALRWAGKLATIIDKPEGELPSRGWVICPYSRLRAIEHLIEMDALILDECHYLKDPRSARTKMIWGRGPKYGLRHRAARVWLLSGTPIPNRLREIAHICVGLRPRAFPSSAAFLKRYCWSGTRFYYGRSVESYDGANEVPELRKLMKEANLICRRQKEDVLTELPAKQRAVVPLCLTEVELRRIDREIALILDEDRQGKVLAALQAGTTIPAMEEFSLARAYLGKAKAMAAAEWLAEEAREQKIVTFCWHRAAGEALVEELGKLGIKATFSSGDMFPEERQASIARFTQDKAQQVWIGTIGACGTGLNGLQLASTRCVFLEASYVPSQNVQAEDRLHRMGQLGSVLVQYLYAPVALDMHLMKLVASKANDISLVLD